MTGPLRIYLTRPGAVRPRQWAGVSRYTSCLVSAVRRQAPDVEFCAAHFSLRGRLPPDHVALAEEFGIRLRPVRCPDLSGVAGYLELLDRWVLPRHIERSGAQIAWGTNCSVPSSRRRRFRSVVTIHDLFLLERPELAAPEFYRHTLRQVRSLPDRCDLVLTDSQFSRGQIVRVLGMPAERVIVTPLAPAPTTVSPIAEPAAVLARLELAAPLVLSVGTVEARKNYERGLEAFAELRRRGVGTELNWLIAGGRGWKADDVMATRDRLGLAACVRVRHDLTDVDLSALYRTARCLFFPSPHEGFGLPAVEAMAAGLPVVAARAGALPEVVADAAELVDPDSPAEMAAGLERVLVDRERHADLAARGLRRAAEFSWDRAAALAVAAFRKLSDQPC